jgi:hypothetical protein
MQFLGLFFVVDRLWNPIAVMLKCAFSARPGEIQQFQFVWPLFDHGGLPLGAVCSAAAVVAAKAAPEEVGDVSAILNAVWPRLPRPAQPSGLAWSHPKISLLREFVLRAQANLTSHPPDRVSSPFLYAIHIASFSLNKTPSLRTNRPGRRRTIHSFRITQTHSHSHPSHRRVTSALRTPTTDTVVCPMSTTPSNTI